MVADRFPSGLPHGGQMRQGLIQQGMDFRGEDFIGLGLVGILRANDRFLTGLMELAVYFGQFKQSARDGGAETSGRSSGEPLAQPAAVSVKRNGVLFPAALQDVAKPIGPKEVIPLDAHERLGQILIGLDIRFPNSNRRLVQISMLVLDLQQDLGKAIDLPLSRGPAVTVEPFAKSTLAIIGLDGQFMNIIVSQKHRDLLSPVEMVNLLLSKGLGQFSNLLSMFGFGREVLQSRIADETDDRQQG